MLSNNDGWGGSVDCIRAPFSFITDIKLLSSPSLFVISLALSPWTPVLLSKPNFDFRLLFDLLSRYFTSFAL